MTPALEIRGLGKAFGGRHALRDVSLDVGADELVVVLGPAGAGKTTLLRSIAGLEQPEEGAIRLDGRDVSGVPPADRDVALVFQDFSLYPDWRVATTLACPRRAPGRALPGRELSERVQWAAALLHITPLLGRPSHLLSGGEQQRVAIGRALVRRPKLFLLDEPLTNLDAKLRERLRAEIAALRRDLRVPMLYVTHDQAEALSMADRLVVLGEGRILQVGSPEDVYRRPISPAVARQ
ncbi:MAG: ABC transporter ATP-binding protein, partial [bacterium]